jgi:ribosomal protein L34E
LDAKPQIWEDHRTTYRIKAKKTPSRHIVFKLQKIRDKEKIPAMDTNRKIGGICSPVP